jgi:Zn-dependent M16 (insulinase) family peptidase
MVPDNTIAEKEEQAEKSKLQALKKALNEEEK